MPETITLKDVGPIKELSFTLQDHGLTVLTGANGRGKSIALSAIQAAARGSGRVPLRDGARKGSVDAAGAFITVGASCRHSGQFDIINLEGRFDLSTLVDPKLKSADAADRQRIKALIALTGVKASRDLFTQHDAFKDTFGEVVSDESTATDDLCEMASKVKRDYESKSRAWEETAVREEGHARGLEEAGEGIDLSLPHNQISLQEDYDAARDEYSRRVTLAETRAKQQAAADEARANLERLQEEHAGINAVSAKQQLEAAEQSMKEAQQRVAKLQNDLANAESMADQATTKWRAAQQVKLQADNYARLREQYESTLNAWAPGEPVDVEAARVKMAEAADASNNGAIIREAKRKLGLAQAHKNEAAKAREAAFNLRQIAQTTDEVLSAAIKCDALRIESIDGQARLVVDHPARGVTPFHELSEGERWKIALDLGVEQVGEGGLLVLEQSAYESVDTFNRQIIHEHAKARRVFLLTAEATRDPADGTEMKARPYEEANA